MKRLVALCVEHRAASLEEGAARIAAEVQAVAVNLADDLLLLGCGGGEMTALKNELRAELPATLEAIESFCAEFQHWRAETCAELDAFSTELLLREALTNSVVHGSANAGRGGFLACCGPSPGASSWRFGMRAPASTGARPGIATRFRRTRTGAASEILRRYSNAVRFNPKGNSVTLIKRFQTIRP